MELLHKFMVTFLQIIVLLYNYHLIMKLIGIDRRSYSEVLKPQITW